MANHAAEPIVGAVARGRVPGLREGLAWRSLDNVGRLGCGRKSAPRAGDREPHHRRTSARLRERLARFHGLGLRPARLRVLADPCRGRPRHSHSTAPYGEAQRCSKRDCSCERQRAPSASCRRLPGHVGDFPNVAPFDGWSCGYLGLKGSRSSVCCSGNHHIGEVLMATKAGYMLGDQVLVPWGLDELVGVVVEVYGPSGSPSVLVEVPVHGASGETLEVTTVSFPAAALKPVG